MITKKRGVEILTELKFKRGCALEEITRFTPGHAILGNNIYFHNHKIAELYQRDELYENLLEPNDIDYSIVIAEKLLPDAALLNIQNNTLYIIDMRLQKSTDYIYKKLQTCDFKNRQYKKLLAPLNIEVKYVYVLNDWFAKPEYKDVLGYIKSVGCYYFFNELPLDFLNLPKPN